MWYSVHMIRVDTKDIKEMEADLKTFARKAYPFATKNTVNTAAFRTQKIARNDIQSDLTLRNRFTVQSVQVEQSRTLQVSRQAAIVGSTADYMEDQEFGGIKARKGKQGVAIPTGYSAGQEGAEPRTRLPRKANKLASIQLSKRKGRKMSRAQRNLVAVKVAAASSNKYIFMDLGKRKGIFRVLGGKRNPRVKMVHDLSEQAVTIPRNPWLGPAVDQVEQEIPDIYRRSLRFQLKRLNLFK